MRGDIVGHNKIPSKMKTLLKESHLKKTNLIKPHEKEEEEEVEVYSKWEKTCNIM